jgi:hypothetical protein
LKASAVGIPVSVSSSIVVVVVAVVVVDVVVVDVVVVAVVVEANLESVADNELTLGRWVASTVSGIQISP